MSIKSSVRTLVILSTFLATLNTPEAAHARPRQDFVTCNQNQKNNINAVWQYLRENLKVLRKDYEWDGRLPRDRKRVNRRMGREIGDTTVVCQGTNEFRCRSGTGRSSGVFSSRIHICFNKIDAESSGNRGFCRLAEVVAHEFAHSIGMQRRIGHGKDGLDEVRMFGRFVRDMCAQDRLDRDLTPFTSQAPSPPSPTTGVSVFSKDFANRVRNFTSPANDLREVGRNNSISSIRVLTGSWELCDRRDFLGWCLEVSADTALDKKRLKALKMNDKISSLRPISLPRTDGITIYSDRRMRGRSAHFESSIRDLSQVKLANKAKSLSLDGGTWSVCKKKDYRKCTLVSGNVEDLRTIGYNKKIRSIRRES